MSASESHLPIMATEHPNYDVRRYRETVQLVRLAWEKIEDPDYKAELDRLESLTEEQKAAEYPKK